MKKTILILVGIFSLSLVSFYSFDKRGKPQDECLKCSCLHVEGTTSSGVDWLVYLGGNGQYFYWTSANPSAQIPLANCNAAISKAKEFKSISIN